MVSSLDLLSCLSKFDYFYSIKDTVGSRESRHFKIEISAAKGVNSTEYMERYNSPAAHGVGIERIVYNIAPVMLFDTSIRT